MAESEFVGRTALITGASRGIGLAIATALTRAGANVMLTSRKAEQLQQAVQSIVDALEEPEARDRLAWNAGHAGSETDAEQCVARTMQRFGGLDILVNNAATNPHMGATIDADLAAFDKTVQVNLRGPLAWTQQAWRAHMRDHGGAIVNVVSIGAFRVGGPLGIYENTKAALMHLTGHLALELAPRVRVNAVAPGLVKTDFAKALWETGEEERAERVPLKRLGRPDDVSDAVLFLLSNAASWITGHTMVVDGGSMLVH